MICFCICLGEGPVAPFTLLGFLKSSLYFYPKDISLILVEAQSKNSYGLVFFFSKVTNSSLRSLDFYR